MINNVFPELVMLRLTRNFSNKLKAMIKQENKNEIEQNINYMLTSNMKSEQKPFYVTTRS